MAKKPAYEKNYYTSKFRGDKLRFSNKISPPGVRIFIFSPKHKAWAAYWPNGELAGYGRASGGLKQKDINAIINEINGRPLKCLNYKTPEYLFLQQRYPERILQDADKAV